MTQFSFLDAKANREYALRVDLARRPLEEEHEKRRQELVAKTHAHHMQNSGLFVAALFKEDFNHAKAVVEAAVDALFSVLEARGINLADERVVEIQDSFAQDLRSGGEGAIQAALKGPDFMDPTTAAATTQDLPAEIEDAVVACRGEIELRTLELRRKLGRQHDSTTPTVEPVQRADSGFDSVKRRLAGQLEELKARFSEATSDAVFVRLFDPATQAAPLAALLGFSKPPVEFVVIRAPERHPLLDANPGCDCVTALRVNDPSGLTYTQADLGANGKEPSHTGPPARIDPPAPAILRRMHTNLESWRRAVDRLVPEDIHHRPPGDDPPRSPQMFLYVAALQRLLGGPLSQDSVNPATDALVIKQIAQQCEEMAGEYVQQHPLVAVVQPDQHAHSSSGPPSTPAGKSELPDKLSNIKAARLYAQLSDGRPNAPWMGKKLKELKLPHWTEHSVVALHLSVKAKKKRVPSTPTGGRYTCPTCNQRCPRPLGAYKQCYGCLMKRHSADTTPL